MEIGRFSKDLFMYLTNYLSIRFTYIVELIRYITENSKIN